MREYHVTVSQMIGIAMLLIFAFGGWMCASYLWGHWQGYNTAYKTIVIERYGDVERRVK